MANTPDFTCQEIITETLASCKRIPNKELEQYLVQRSAELIVGTTDHKFLTGYLQLSAASFEYQRRISCGLVSRERGEPLLQQHGLSSSRVQERLAAIFKRASRAQDQGVTPESFELAIAQATIKAELNLCSQEEGPLQERIKRTNDRFDRERLHRRPRRNVH